MAGVGQSYEANASLSGDGTWVYGYDLDNRLRTASKPGTTATLSYDAEGRLRQTTIGGVTTNLLYDGTKLIAEYDAAGTTVTKRYVHGPGTDEPIVVYDGASTTNKSWLYTDHLGSVVATANSTGASTGIYSYGPYGEPNTTAPTSPRFRYTGQQLIPELGLYYYKARFYSPALGRFLQTDPSGLTGVARGLAADFNSYFAQVQAQQGVQIAQVLPAPLYMNPWTAGPAVVATGCMLSSGCQGVISGAINWMMNEDGNSGGARPEGVPENWVASPSRDGKGTKWVDPSNPKGGDYVRERGDGTLTQVKGGRALDVNGNPAPGLSTPEAHFPREDWKFIP